MIEPTNNVTGIGFPNFTASKNINLENVAHIASRKACSILCEEIEPEQMYGFSMLLDRPAFNKLGISDLDFGYVAPKMPSAKKLKYLKCNPPYHYGNDMFFANLNIIVKNESPNFPFIQVDTKKVIYYAQSNSEINNMVIENEYRKLAKLEGFSNVEKLSIIYMSKIKFYLNEVLRNPFQVLKPLSSSKNFKENIDLSIKDCIESNQIDLMKLNILTAIVVCYAVRGSQEPYTTPEWTNVLSAVTSEWGNFNHIFNDFAHNHGLGRLTSYSNSGPVKISNEESKMFVPMMTKSGMFGAETFLNLFFNKMIPYCSNLTWQSIHNGSIQSPYGILTHDIEHAFRTIPIMRDETWFKFLHNCYKEILTCENLAGSKNLIMYLFIITHEIGITKEKACDFNLIINQRYKFDSIHGRIEYDDAFVKMLELVAKDGLTLERGKEDQFVISVLSNLHEEFDNRFKICEKAKSMIQHEEACGQDSNNYFYCAIL